MSNRHMKSQKARGVQFLQMWNGGLVPPVAFWRMPSTEPNGPLGSRDVPKYGYPAFARPCPTAPRHGFVDSRVVNSADEAAQVYAEALAADAGAELMLMPLIDADRSAVLTPQWAAIGNGHDGATAGKAGTLAVQLLHTAIPRGGDDLVPADQVPYLELVYGAYRKPDAYASQSRRDAWFVQLRSGPSIGGQGAGNYIPNDVVVSRVIDAHALDALALEAALNEAEASEAQAAGTAKRGLVIWQANGNPCSHASCHARLHSLPIVFDVDAPAIGTALSATSDADEPMNERAIRRAVRAFGAAKYSLTDSMPASILWAIHQAPALARSAEGAAFVAQACVNLWRYAATACIGEARHSYFVNGKRRRRSRQRARHTIYMKALTKAGTDTYLRTRTTMALAAYSLADNFAGGYGGPAWEACTRATLALYDALAALTNFKGSANDVIIAAHAVVNSAHNNGPFLNKFIGGEAFENAAHGCAILAVRSLEELHLHASAHRAAEDGPKWPQRKHKAAKVLTVSDVQWNLRQQGTLLHAQTSLGAVKGSHLSGSIPLAMLPVSEIRAIMLCAAFAEQNCTSLAGSSSRYWQARGVLSLETIRIIFPTI